MENKIKNKKTAIIFDLDGTMWDSRSATVEAWNKCLIENKIPHRTTLEELTSVFGKNTKDISDIVFSECYADGKERMEITLKCIDQQEKHLRKNGAILYDGLFETLKKLKSESYELFICSNCQSGYIETFLDYYKLNSYFKDKICYGDTKRPKFENINFLIEKHKLEKDNCVYVGDTLGDLTASKEANIDFIWAEFGFGKSLASEYSISKLADLPNMINQKNRKECCRL